MKPTRAVAIILRDDQVALIKRQNKNHHYFVFPGGGVEAGETIKEAVLREVKEETCMKVAISKLIYHHHYIGHSDQYFYLCEHLEGEPKLGNFNEKQDMAKNEDQWYEPKWIGLNELNKLLVYPLEIRDWLLEDVNNSFEKTPRFDSIFIDEIRQKL